MNFVSGWSQSSKLLFLLRKPYDSDINQLKQLDEVFEKTVVGGVKTNNDGQAKPSTDVWLEPDQLCSIVLVMHPVTIIDQVRVFFG